MKSKLIPLCILSVLLTGVFSCKKNTPDNPAPTPTPTPTSLDTTGPLKSANTFALGFAVEYSQMSGNATFASVVAREGNWVTFGNELKYGSIVQNDGSFNYTTADALYTLCSNAGLQVYGHNLSWYQQNNTTYLSGIVSGSAAGSSNLPNLLMNGGFETTGGGLFVNWTVFNPANNTGGNGYFAIGTGADAHSGTNSMQAIVTTGGTNYLVQMSSAGFTTIVGHKYNVSFWIKAATAGGSEQIEFQYDAPTGTSAQYSGNMNNTTAWTQVNFSFTATGTTARLVFDMGQVVNTYDVDDVSVTDVSAAPPAPAAVATAVDSVFKNWITSTVTHYAGKITAWDVVNEPMSDGTGALRTSANAGVSPLPAGQFYWSDYLGRQYALKAFQYARAANPSALLFVNEYNLESSPTKLDSLLGYVAELQAAGAPIDGIGTQMHISILTPNTGIDAAFQRLAATGLKIRISELDIRLNPQEQPGFNPLAIDTSLLSQQSAKYNYVVNSYLKNVPSGQRFGITVWGVDDPESWIILSQGQQDAPLLFDRNFARKPAYAGFLQGLKGK
jgi:endo-1,4-beta-xylanase